MNVQRRNFLLLVTLAAAAAMPAMGQNAAPVVGPSSTAADAAKIVKPPRPGVSILAVKHEISSLTPAAIFPVEGRPDWTVITDDAVWVANVRKKTVHRLDPKTNQVAAVVEVGKRPWLRPHRWVW